MSGNKKTIKKVAPNTLTLNMNRTRNESFWDAVNRCAEFMKSGGVLPAVKVFVLDDGTRFVGDGAIRVEAAKQAGMKVAVEFCTGGREAAERCFAKANRATQMPLTDADRDQWIVNLWTDKVFTKSVIADLVGYKSQMSVTNALRRMGVVSNDGEPRKGRDGVVKNSSGNGRKPAAKSASLVTSSPAVMITDDAKTALSDAFSDEYYGGYHIDLIRGFYGGQIDIDPFSCPQANKHVRASKFITPRKKADPNDDAHTRGDGLTDDWTKRDGSKGAKAHVNPPFSVKKGGGFARALEAIERNLNAGNISEAILTCHTLHHNTWFREKLADVPVCLLYKRVEFERDNDLTAQDPDAPTSPRLPIMIAYFGDRPLDFIKYFAPHGKTDLPLAVVRNLMAQGVDLGEIVKTLGPAVNDNAEVKAA